MHKINKIYLDMDGVIADFMGRYKKMFGESIDKQKKKEWKENFQLFIDSKQFETLDMEPDAQDLINYLMNQEIPVEILSSTAKKKYHDEVSRQKTIWLNHHHIPFKPNFVPGKAHKVEFATPTSLIIDDTLSIIDDWKEAGGPAIHHKNARETMVMLKFYLL